MNVRNAWIAVALLGMAGCGGGSNVPSCGTFNACGGAVVGSWVKAKRCGTLTDASCPAAKLDLKKDTQISVTFGSDMTVASTLSASELIVTAPSSCVASTVTCASLSNTSSTQTVTCQTSGSNCVCDQKLNSSTASGTYSLSGSTITIVVGGVSQTFDYCVKDDTLYIPYQGSSYDIYKAVAN